MANPITHSDTQTIRSNQTLATNCEHKSHGKDVSAGISKSRIRLCSSFKKIYTFRTSKGNRSPDKAVIHIGELNLWETELRQSQDSKSVLYQALESCQCSCVHGQGMSRDQTFILQYTSPFMQGSPEIVKEVLHNRKHVESAHLHSNLQICLFEVANPLTETFPRNKE